VLGFAGGQGAFWGKAHVGRVFESRAGGGDIAPERWPRETAWPGRGWWRWWPRCPGTPARTSGLPARRSRIDPRRGAGARVGGAGPGPDARGAHPGGARRRRIPPRRADPVHRQVFGTASPGARSSSRSSCGSERRRPAIVPDARSSAPSRPGAAGRRETTSGPALL
jgi:hypothetical protein